MTRSSLQRPSFITVSGVILGTPALTSRGFVEEDFAKVAHFFDAAVQLAVKIKAETKGSTPSYQCICTFYLNFIACLFPHSNPAGTKLKDFVATLSTPSFQSEAAKLRHDVEEYAKQFPTIGFEKETMKYKN